MGTVHDHRRRRRAYSPRRSHQPGRHDQDPRHHHQRPRHVGSPPSVAPRSAHIPSSAQPIPTVEPAHNNKYQIRNPLKPACKADPPHYNLGGGKSPLDTLVGNTPSIATSPSALPDRPST